MSPTRAIRIVALAVLASLVTIAATGARGSDPTPVYETRTPSGNGIGKVYMGREIANVMSHYSMSRLDRPGRERDERTDLLVEALPVEADDAVADIGAGTGYFSFRVAERVPNGVVYAVDIQQEMLDEIERRKSERGVDNIETLLGRIDDPGVGRAERRPYLHRRCLSRVFAPARNGRGNVQGAKARRPSHRGRGSRRI